MTLPLQLMGAAVLTAMLAGAAIAKVPPPVKPASDAGVTMTCGIPVVADASEESLKAAVGAKNVVFKDLGGPEGEELLGSQVYGDDPSKTFDVIWSDGEKRANPDTINVTQMWVPDGEGSVDPVWKTVEGVRVGMSIEEVEKLNGKPFRLYGFGWDYAGSIISFEGGKLDEQPGSPCHLTMVFYQSSDTPADSTMGEVGLMSDAKDVRNSRPLVGRFSITYVRPDAEQTEP